MAISPLGQRFEQNLRVVNIFFPALVGFGLSSVLNNTNSPFSPDKNLVFLVGAFIFLRLLIGSTNHLWIEYVEKGDKQATQRMFFDIFWLVLFSIATIIACRAACTSEFLFRIAFVPLLAFLSTAIGLIRLLFMRWQVAKGARLPFVAWFFQEMPWWHWLALDPIEAGVMFYLASGPAWLDGDLCGWTARMVVAVGVSAVVCFIDCHVQIVRILPRNLPLDCTCHVAAHAPPSRS